MEDRVNELELFAGAGGGILGSQLIGHRTVCAVEYDAYARSVLLARQADGTFPHFPIWDDVRTFDGRPWRGIVDVVSGGFPCQDISVAGSGAGLDGERSGLWSEMARIIGEVQPRYAFIENSPALVTRGLDRVLCDLAAMGFDARWGVVSAADVGAFHRRERIWILAHANDSRQRSDSRDWSSRESQASRNDARRCGDDVADTNMRQRNRPELAVFAGGNATNYGCENVPYSASIRQQGPWKSIDASHCTTSGKRKAGNAFNVRQFREWPTEPAMGRVVNGMADRTHQLKAIGNGQVSRVRAAAWTLLHG